MKKKNNKKFKLPRPSSNVAVSNKWTVIVFILSFFLSVAFGAVTSVLMEKISIVWAFVILLVIIALNIGFDLIGTAVMSAEEAPFHSLATRRVNGASMAISIIRHAPQMTSMCCDVIGDIAGIISGSATAYIVSELVSAFSLSGLLPSLVLTGLVGALTIGGKAVFKGVGMKNGNAIVFAIAKVYTLVKKR